MPQTPRVPGKSDPTRHREGEVQTRTRRKVQRPPRFKVVLYNDDYTPMEFVVALLEQVFDKNPAVATQLMLQIHRSGFGVAGVYVLEVAETKLVTVHRMAEDRGYPLCGGVEPE
jgi:ATP-dependent Clp protease adaptor protein ClpS